MTAILSVFLGVSADYSIRGYAQTKHFFPQNFREFFANSCFLVLRKLVEKHKLLLSCIVCICTYVRVVLIVKK